MLFFARIFRNLLLMITVVFSSLALANPSLNIPILCYHNFNPTKPGSMNLKPARLEEQLKWLRDNGFTVIPLKEAVAYIQGKRQTLPSKPVVITADDGWKSAYTYMFPLVKKYHVPVTLFIYPQNISHGKNFMTWDELKELQQTGLFDIQGHTYSHPNFKHEKKILTPLAYQKLLKKELETSKSILEEKLGTKIVFLAWPFGIYNTDLEAAAAKAGYTMAFTIDYRKANKSFKPMAEPRYMIIASQTMKTFAGIVSGPRTPLTASSK